MARDLGYTRIDGSMIADGTLRTLDLSAFGVSANATGVVICSHNDTGALIQPFWIRRPGDTAWPSYGALNTRVNFPAQNQWVVGVDASQQIEYVFGSAPTAVYLVWEFESEATFITPTEFQGSSGNWTTIDVSSVIPANALAILANYAMDDNSTNLSMGGRYANSGLPWADATGSSTFRQCTCIVRNFNQTMDFYTQSSGIGRLHVVGYLTAGFEAGDESLITPTNTDALIHTLTGDRLALITNTHDSDGTSNSLNFKVYPRDVTVPYDRPAGTRGISWLAPGGTNNEIWGQQSVSQWLKIGIEGWLTTPSSPVTEVSGDVTVDPASVAVVLDVNPADHFIAASVQAGLPDIAAATLKGRKIVRGNAANSMQMHDDENNPRASELFNWTWFDAVGKDNMTDATRGPSGSNTTNPIGDWQVDVSPAAGNIGDLGSLQVEIDSDPTQRGWGTFTIEFG